MYAILYQSKHTNKVAFTDICKSAQLPNANYGITGCLLQTPKYIFQYIEGPIDHAHQLTANIARDPRHFDVNILHRVNISSRLFPDWTMQHLNATDAMQIDINMCDRTTPLFVQHLLEYMATAYKPQSLFKYH